MAYSAPKPPPARTSARARLTCRNSRRPCWRRCCPTRVPGTRPSRAPMSPGGLTGFASRCGNWAAATTSTSCNRSSHGAGQANPEPPGSALHGALGYRLQGQHHVILHPHCQPPLRVDPGFTLGQRQAQTRLPEGRCHTLSRYAGRCRELHTLNWLTSQLADHLRTQWLLLARQPHGLDQTGTLGAAQLYLGLHLPESLFPVHRPAIEQARSLLGGLRLQPQLTLDLGT